MLSGIFLVLFCFLFFFHSSLQVMVLLLGLESLVLLASFFMTLNYLWFSFVMLIMTGVCLGAYGISVLISNTNSKSYLYFCSL